MTPAQQRILEDVRAKGQKVYNGHAYRPVKALVKLGLVVADFDMRAVTKGNGFDLMWVITVRPV